MKQPSRITWSIPLLTSLIGSLIALITKWKEIDKDIRIILLLVLVIATAIVLLTIFLYNFFSTLIENVSYKLKKIYSPFIYNSIKVRLKYLDPAGNSASYYRHDHIIKLSLRKSKRILKVPVEVDGKIVRSKVSTINSGFSFATNNIIVFHCYFDDANLLGKEHHASYSFVTKDSFKNKEEYWIFRTDRYCNHYWMDISIPDPARVIEAKILHRNKKVDDTDNLAILDNQNGGWSTVVSPKLMILKDHGCTIITVKLTAVTATDDYKIVWTLQ